MIDRVVPNFNTLSFEDKVKTVMCPFNTSAVKLVNKYIRIIFNARSRLDSGVPLSCLTFPPMVSSFVSLDGSVITSSSDSESESD